MSALAFFLVLVALIIDAVLFFTIGAIYGLAARINQLEKIGYKVTKNDE
jgi:hypothetical protein